MWKNGYHMMYCQLLEALGFISPDIGNADELHSEALARARQYRRWVVDCSLDNPEEWDD